MEAYNSLRFTKKKCKVWTIRCNYSSITRQVLTEQLKKLEEDGIVKREAFSELPPRVEYSLTEKGLEFLPILNSIIVWNEKYETESTENYCPTSSYFKY